MHDKPRPGARPCIAAFEGCSSELSGVFGCRVGCIDKWLLKQNSAKEYSLEELLEHPVLGVQMTSEGIDRRCLDLMFDAAGAQHRFAEAEYRERFAGSFTP